MATTIAASVGTSMSAATGRPYQGHLVYATNLGKWWLTYLSGTNGLSALSSTDFSAWAAPTGSPFTLTQNHASEGRNFGFTYKNIASTDVLHMVSGYLATGGGYHARFTLGSTWSRTNAEALTGSAIAAAAVSGGSTCLDSANKPWDGYPYLYNGTDYENVETAPGSNADAGTSWTAGMGAPSARAVANNSTKSQYIDSLGSGNLITIGDAGTVTTDTFTIINSFKYTGTWTSEASVFGGVTATSNNNWTADVVSATDVHAVCLSNNSNTFMHRRSSDSLTWNAGQAIATLTLQANSGLALVPIGANAYLFAIDSSNNVKYMKWTAATPAWDGAWTTLDAGGASARTYVTACAKSDASSIGVVWTEVNGANFNIAGAILSLAAAPAFIAEVPLSVMQASKRASFF